MRPVAMATQITLSGGERIGVVQGLDEVVRSLTRTPPSDAGLSLVMLTREDGSAVHINPAQVLYVRTVQ